MNIILMRSDKVLCARRTTTEVTPSALLNKNPGSLLFLALISCGHLPCGRSKILLVISGHPMAFNHVVLFSRLNAAHRSPG